MNWSKCTCLWTWSPLWRRRDCSLYKRVSEDGGGAWKAMFSVYVTAEMSRARWAESVSRTACSTLLFQQQCHDRCMLFNKYKALSEVLFSFFFSNHNQSTNQSEWKDNMLNIKELINANTRPQPCLWSEFLITWSPSYLHRLYPALAFSLPASRCASKFAFIATGTSSHLWATSSHQGSTRASGRTSWKRWSAT